MRQRTGHLVLLFSMFCLIGIQRFPIGNADAAPPGDKRLASLAAEPLPLGAIKPAGWLRRQLQIQAGGLGGHLDEFWPDVKDSAWVGGAAEGWERGPYWLDGFLPLAIQLDDPALKARASRWVEHILTTQAQDGWLGPIKGNPSTQSRLAEYDVWPRFIVLKALTQWQEATGDERVVPAMTRLLRRLDTLLDQRPMQEWARVRWADLSLSIYWLYDRTHEPWLLDLTAKVREQGLDWPSLAKDFPYRDVVTRETLNGFKAKAGGQWINDEFGATHGVNVAMGIKAPGVWSRQSGDAADREAVFALLGTIDRYHGQATGMFTCDEHLAGRSPSQGTELCTVVELMYSLETLLAIMPDVRLADRLESIAYNALPATFTDDMWAHQYDQQANQVVCKISPERVYTNNGPDANIFGLKPNFACCLANMHQGWPKFTANLWMKSDAGGLTAMAYAPCDVKTTVAGVDVELHVRTDYPFTDTISITVASSKPAEFPLDFRIPVWAEGATIAINGVEPMTVQPGGFHRVNRQWSGQNNVRLKLPLALRAERRFNDSVTIHRGPLVFALEIGQEWRKLREQPPTADWEVHPTAAWNYALALDPGNLANSLEIRPATVAERPFSSQSPAVRLIAKARPIEGWELEKNAATPPPKSPIRSTVALEEVVLIPYASAKLRITELPILADD
jgi:DUF1680 family protein